MSSGLLVGVPGRCTRGSTRSAGCGGSSAPAGPSCSGRGCGDVLTNQLLLQMESKAQALGHPALGERRGGQHSRAPGAAGPHARSGLPAGGPPTPATGRPCLHGRPSMPQPPAAACEVSPACRGGPVGSLHPARRQASQSLNVQEASVPKGARRSWASPAPGGPKCSPGAPHTGALRAPRR